MINVINHNKCCGCEACIQVCHQKCISAKTDKEGFLYPEVNISACIDCGLCEKVCPHLTNGSPRIPMKAIGAKNISDEIRIKSSSGGVFSALSNIILESGGIIYGACFNENWEVHHVGIDNITDLQKLRLSKYVQSKIGNVYSDVKMHLNARRKVMFTGTPCQIYGLRLYLRKEYSNLLCVEIACHGVPSPLVWEKYISHFSSREVIKSVNFRDKSKGWENYKIKLINSKDRIVYQKQSVYDPYLSCFLRHLTIRPSCFQCNSKNGKSGADILIGDLWGCEQIAPHLNDKKGISLVLAYTTKGFDYIKQSQIESFDIDYHTAIKYNPAIELSINESDERTNFWNKFLSSSNPYSVIMDFGKPLAPSNLVLVKMAINNVFKRLGLRQ